MSVKSEIRKAVKELIEKGNSLFPTGKLNYNNIEIKFSLYGKTRTGYACLDWDRTHGTLAFHPTLAQQDLDAYIAQTVSHEVAHLFQRKLYPTSKPHGKEFKYVARKLGNSGNRCSSYNMNNIKGRAKQRFIYTCDCMEHRLTEYKHNIMQTYSQYRSGRNYICTRCRKILQWTGKEIVVY